MGSTSAVVFNGGQMMTASRFWEEILEKIGYSKQNRDFVLGKTDHIPFSASSLADRTDLRNSSLFIASDGAVY